MTQWFLRPIARVQTFDQTMIETSVQAVQRSRALLQDTAVLLPQAGPPDHAGLTSRRNSSAIRR